MTKAKAQKSQVKAVDSFRRVIPSGLESKVEAKLGKMPDSQIVTWLKDKHGIDVGRHVIFFMRRTRNIPSFHKQTYTKPSFRGAIEDVHPEIKNLFGKVPIKEIAAHFGVSRSCVRSAMDRCGYKGQRFHIDHSDTLRSMLSESSKKKKAA